MMPTELDSNLSRPRISPGTRLNGIYEIDSLIDVGGMGEIYKGHAIQTGDLVAIKLMLPELADNEAALALFRKEASALHYLQHAAIVRYYVFTIEPVLRRPYLAMEFVDGRSLSEILQDDGPLLFEAVQSLMQRIASGLQAAHDCGIIHRDVSPDNIILPNGDVTRAKIIDFGIARLTQFGDGTVIGSGFAGKFNYVSPEQLGLFGGNVTAKSDIYSLGLVVVQALTGRAIDMGGTQVQIVEKRRVLPNLGGIDARFRPLLERMLQPNPDDRPDTMAACAAWSLSIVKPSAIPSSDERGYGTSHSNSGSARLRPRRWSIALAALLLAAITAGGYYYYSVPLTLGPGQPPPEPEPILTPKGPVTTTITGPGLPRVDLASARTEKIKRYLDQYDGGDCFFITTVALSDNNAAIEGLGASLQPFNSLNQAFMRDNSFEPNISVRQVSPAQCPAITFLSRLRAEQARAPHLDIDKVSIRSGEAIAGLVDRIGNRNIELLLVSDNGTVQNVSNMLKPGTDAKTFNIGLKQRDGVAGSQPQLLITVATVRQIEALRPQGPVSADLFFPPVLSELARSDKSAAASAKYFRLEK